MKHYLKKIYNKYLQNKENLKKKLITTKVKNLFDQKFMKISQL